MSSDRNDYVSTTEDNTDNNHSQARCCIGDQGSSDCHDPERNTDAAHHLDGTDRKWGTARHARDASPRARVWGPCLHGSHTLRRRLSGRNLDFEPDNRRRNGEELGVEDEILTIGLSANDDGIPVLHVSGQDRNRELVAHRRLH